MTNKTWLVWGPQESPETAETIEAPSAYEAAQECFQAFVDDSCADDNTEATLFVAPDPGDGPLRDVVGFALSRTVRYDHRDAPVPAKWRDAR